MNILLASAELTPLAKAGGLADVAASLPIEWKKQGHNPVLIMPKYAAVNVAKYGFVATDMTIGVPIGYWTEYARLWVGKLPGSSDVPVYLIENDDYFNRDGIYGYPNEYQDNDRRYIFFCRAVFEAAKALNFSPDIIHAHDFHTGFIMAFLKSHYRYDPLFSRSAGVFTIHNLAYQGWFNPDRAMEYSCFGMNQFYPGSWFEKNGAVNAMKTGIMFADKITTVSPQYAQEIRYDYYGEGLQDSLNSRAADLLGILNGVQYDEWNPELDNLIFRRYGKNNIADKQLNKNKFLKDKGLGEDDFFGIPLIGMVSRLAEQKGIDLLMCKLESYLASSYFRFAVLGSGEQKYEEYFNYLAWKYPGKIFVYLGYDNSLAHKIIAASDFLMMPSRFEPCGLTQLYALKYGTLPIVRSTGGLADTVSEFDKSSGVGNGFVFNNYDELDLDFAIKRAIEIYYDKNALTSVIKNAINCNFPAAKSAEEYIKVFNWALEKVRY
jgi:starch synthase